MKNKILDILIEASNYNDKRQHELHNRITGIKDDVLTKGDLEIGKLITNYFLNLDYKISIESEEYGIQRNFSSSEEDYYIAIDDIDGSNNLRVGNGLLPYCSMIVVFKKNSKNIQYSYSDYKYAACIEYISGRIFYTEKDLGCVEQYNKKKEKVSNSTNYENNNSGLAPTLSTDIVSTKRGGSLGYASHTIDKKDNIVLSLVDSIYKKYAIVDSGCSVFEYAMVGLGVRDGYISSGKKQHELPLLYAFCNETNKKVCDFSGDLYDNKSYDFNGIDATVIAANDDILNDCLKLIDEQNKFNDKILVKIKNI